MDHNCHVSNFLILQLRKLAQIWRTCKTTQSGRHQAGAQNLSLDFWSNPSYCWWNRYLSSLSLSLSLSPVLFSLKTIFLDSCFLTDSANNGNFNSCQLCIRASDDHCFFLKLCSVQEPFLCLSLYPVPFSASFQDEIVVSLLSLVVSFFILYVSNFLEIVLWKFT